MTPQGNRAAMTHKSLTALDAMVRLKLANGWREVPGRTPPPEDVEDVEPARRDAVTPTSVPARDPGGNVVELVAATPLALEDLVERKAAAGWTVPAPVALEVPPAPASPAPSAWLRAWLDLVALLLMLFGITAFRRRRAARAAARAVRLPLPAPLLMALPLELLSPPALPPQAHAHRGGHMGSGCSDLHAAARSPTGSRPRRRGR